MTQFGVRGDNSGRLARRGSTWDYARVLGQVLSVSDRQYLKKTATVAAVVYFLAAVFSVGYHHPDEHFQILEYVALKLGSADVPNMAWEYHHGMRSWLQPSLLYAVTRVLQGMGLNEPPQWAFVYRLLSGVLSLAAIACFAQKSRPWFQRSEVWRATVLAVFFFWCVPYLAVRTSSETWSSAFLLFGISACLRSPTENQIRGFLWAGLFWGFAFQFRFQAAVAVAGAVAYFLILQRNPRVFLIFPGVILTLLIGIVVDRWGYGYWGVSAWEYFYQNLWVGKVAEFGTSPWWAYPKLLAVKAGPPLSWVLMLGTFWAWFRFPFHLLTWMSVPFFLVHSAIGHKEARFLIPILVPALMQVGLLVDSLERSVGRAGKLGLQVLFALNGLLLLASLLKPADVKSDFYSHVARKVGEEVTLYYKDSHPYGPVSRHKFFWFEGLHFVHFDRPEEFLEAVDKEKSAYLFWREDVLPEAFQAPGVQCELEHATVPPWLYPFDFNGWLRRTPRYNLFLCRKAPLGAASGGVYNQTRQKKL
ncbi:MAG: glycosyltransferase family 39 protein [Bdellovibrionota bacterium]